ncbi:MAG: GNAT family N-acetyltransferase [Actinomycetes bacterium]
MDIRSASLDDLDALNDIAAIIDPPHDGADFDDTYCRHLLQHGRVVVAEASEILLGYAAAIDVDGSQHLSDLFVHQDVRGQHVGRQLLDAVWNGSASPRQTFSSLHPAALPLYVRAGMTPRWPLLYLHGAPERLPVSSFVVEPCDAEAAADHESGWLGWDRRVEYGYWSRRPEAKTFAVLDGTVPVAVGCAVNSRGVRSLGRLAFGDPAGAGHAFAAAARWCGDDVLVAVPGESDVVPMAVESGWRVVELDIYCATEPGLIDPKRLLPHPGLM